MCGCSRPPSMRSTPPSAELDLAVDDRDLAAVLALRDRLDARIAAAVQAVDAAWLWDAVGATSMTAWVTDRGRMARPRAAVMTRVARLVARCR